MLKCENTLILIYLVVLGLHCGTYTSLAVVHRCYIGHNLSSQQLTFKWANEVLCEKCSSTSINLISGSTME